MNDVDFDELDKAISSALAEKKAAKPDLLVHQPQSQPQAASPTGASSATDTASQDSSPASPVVAQSDQSAISMPADTTVATTPNDAASGVSDVTEALPDTTQPTISTRLAPEPTPPAFSDQPSVDRFAQASAAPDIESAPFAGTEDPGSQAVSSFTPQDHAVADTNSTSDNEGVETTADDRMATETDHAQASEFDMSPESIPAATRFAAPRPEITPEDTLDKSPQPEKAQTEAEPNKYDFSAWSTTANSNSVAAADNNSEVSDETTLPESLPATPAVSVPTTPDVTGPEKPNHNLPMQRPRGKFMDITTPSTKQKSSMFSSKNTLMPLSTDEFKPHAETSAVAEAESPAEKPALSPQFAATPTKRDEEPSPFVPDVSVEKRPLGGFGAPALEQPADTSVTDEKPAVEGVESSLAPEMSHEFVALEENEDQFNQRQNEPEKPEMQSAGAIEPEVNTPAPASLPTVDTSQTASEAQKPLTSEDHFAFVSDNQPTPHESSLASEPATPTPITPPAADDTPSPAPTSVPLLKSLPEQEVPAGGSIIQQHGGETNASLEKVSLHAPTVPLLSAENYHPIAAEHHAPWWMWLLIIAGVLALGALTGAAVFMFNPGLF